MSASRFLAVAVALILAVLIAPSSAHAALVGLWQFEGDTADSTSFSNDGALMNGATFSMDSPAPLGPGQSLSLAGGTQHVLVPHDTSLNITNAMTIAGWVRPDNVAWDAILAKSPSSNGSAANHAGNYELRIENSTRLLTFLHQPIGAVNGTVANNSGAGNTIPQAAWTHIAVAVDAGTTSYYINGNPVQTIGTGGNFGATNTNPLYLGTRADLFTTMNGLLDDVAVFNQKLIQSDVAAIMGGDFRSFGVGGEAPDGSLLGNVRIADVSSQLGAPFNRSAQFIIDGSGLSPTGGHTAVPDRFMWLSDGIGFGGPGDDADPYIIFDLGSFTQLDAIQVWNYNETQPGLEFLLNRGVAQMEVSISNSINGPFDSLGVFDLAIAPVDGTLDFSELFDVEAAGRYVMFDILSNHNGTTFPAPGGGPDASFVGLSEVRFFGSTPVPEPATGTLGVLAVAALMWRRRRSGGRVA